MTFLPVEINHSDMARPIPPPPPVTMAHLKSSDLEDMLVEGKRVFAVVDQGKFELKSRVRVEEESQGR